MTTYSLKMLTYNDCRSFTLLWTYFNIKVFHLLTGTNPCCRLPDVQFIQGVTDTWLYIANRTPGAPLLSSTVDLSVQTLHLALSVQVLGIALDFPILQSSFSPEEKKKWQKLSWELDYNQPTTERISIILLRKARGKKKSGHSAAHRNA